MANGDLVDSRLWAGLAEASDYHPTVVVLCSDGDANDADTVSRLRAVRDGPPVVLLDVGSSEEGTATLARIAELSGGQVFPVVDADGAAEAVASFLQQALQVTYRLRYAAPLEGQLERVAQVRLGGEGPAAAAPYALPPVEQRRPARRLVGLALRLDHDERGVTRALAGHQGGELATEAVLPAAQTVEELALGSVSLSFEGGAPTRSAWLQDLLTTKLRQRALLEAVGANDLARAEALAAEGVPVLAPELSMLHAPLAPEGGAPTFPTELRVALSTLRPRLDQDTLEARVDLLPLSRYATSGPDPAVAFALTLRRTLRLALLEAALYERSTASLLGDAPLVHLEAGARDVSAALPALSEEQRAAWNTLLRPYRGYHRLLPASGAPLAFWAIDPQTGSALGVMPDGSGGAAEVRHIEQTLRDIETYLAFLDLLLAAGGAPQGVGIIVAYGQMLARLYARAAIVVASLSAAGADEAVRAAIFDLACGVLRGSLNDVLGTGFATMNLFVQALEVMLGLRYEGVGICSALGP